MFDLNMYVYLSTDIQYVILMTMFVNLVCAKNIYVFYEHVCLSSMFIQLYSKNIHVFHTITIHVTTSIPTNNNYNLMNNSFSKHNIYGKKINAHSITQKQIISAFHVHNSDAYSMFTPDYTKNCLVQFLIPNVKSQTVIPIKSIMIIYVLC